jgi:hypothetical protein
MNAATQIIHIFTGFTSFANFSICLFCIFFFLWWWFPNESCVYFLFDYLLCACKASLHAKSPIWKMRQALPYL